MVPSVVQTCVPVGVRFSAPHAPSSWLDLVCCTAATSPLPGQPGGQPLAPWTGSPALEALLLELGLHLQLPSSALFLGETSLTGREWGLPPRVPTGPRSPLPPPGMGPHRGSAGLLRWDPAGSPPPAPLAAVLQLPVTDLVVRSPLKAPTQVLAQARLCTELDLKRLCNLDQRSLLLTLSSAPFQSKDRLSPELPVSQPTAPAVRQALSLVLFPFYFLFLTPYPPSPVMLHTSVWVPIKIGSSF